MKIAVITRHAVANYGSLLQTIATQQMIEQSGHSCEIIDYIRCDESDGYQERVLLQRKPNWNKNIFRRILYLLVRVPESFIVGKRFQEKRKKILHLTHRYRSVEELRRDKPEADLYMTGSDQVWGATVNGKKDDAYFLSFTEEGDRRAAFGASFGSTLMTEEQRASFQKWLKRYDFIAVREKSAQEMLAGMGIESSLVLDPTMMFDKETWEKYCAIPNERRYLLVYQIHNDPKMNAYAKQAAKEMGLKLIRVSPSLHQILRPGRLIWCPAISLFLGYIRNAEYIVTDSFHGTAFSILFNRPFVEFLPQNNTQTRNQNILMETGLTGRIVRDAGDVNLLKKPIDYAPVNVSLARRRDESWAVMKKMLSQFDEENT